MTPDAVDAVAKAKSCVRRKFRTVSQSSVALTTGDSEGQPEFGYRHSSGHGAVPRVDEPLADRAIITSVELPRRQRAPDWKQEHVARPRKVADND